MPRWPRLDGTLFTQIYSDQSPIRLDAAPLLALDMFEHAYHLDFGANTEAYVDAFMRNIDWLVVADRLRDAGGEPHDHPQQNSRDALPSVSVEDLSQILNNDQRAQVIDARPKHYFSRVVAGRRRPTGEVVDHSKREFGILNGWLVL